MPATPTYSSVSPLKGLGETRAASVSYRASVPAGHAGCGFAPSYRALSPDGENLKSSFKALPDSESIPTTPPPFRHAPNHSWPQPTATVWRNLLRNPLLCLQPTTSVWRNLLRNPLLCLQPTTTVWRNLLRNPLLCLQPTTSVWRNLQQTAPCLV